MDMSAQLQFLAAQQNAQSGMSNSQALAKAKREFIGRDVGLGNIDLNDRPQVANPDGSVSTVYSMTFGPEEDGKYVLVPGVRPGLDRQMDYDEAYDWYKKTGQHLGRFGSSHEVDKYAEALHQSQARIYPNE